MGPFPSCKDFSYEVKRNMPIIHPAQLWNNLMKRLASKGSKRELNEAAKAAEWLQKKIGGHAEWSPSRAIVGSKVYSPMVSKDDFRFLMDHINKNPGGPAVTLKETVLNRYSPALNMLNKATIGGGEPPASAAILHELGHQWSRGPKWVQPATVSGMMSAPIQYAQRLADALPTRIPGSFMMRYLEKSPLLIEELRASANAMHALKKTNASLPTRAAVGKTLTGAFGTYVNPFQ